MKREIILFVFLALQYSFCSFEIFACGTKMMLGIGDKSIVRENNFRKVLIPEEYSKKTLIYLASSKNHAIAQTDDGTLLQWGFNDNGFMNDYLPKKYFDTPQVYKVPQNANYTPIIDDQHLFLVQGKSKIITQGFPLESAENFLKGVTTRKSHYDEFEGEMLFLPQTRNPYAQLLPLKNGNYLEFGAMMSVDGDLLLSQNFSFRVRSTNLIGFPMKIQGLDSIFLVLDENFALFTWGHHEHASLVGVTSDNPYIFSIDNTDYMNPKVTHEPPTKIYKPTRISFNISGTYINQFRNVYSGTHSTIALTMDKRFIGWGRNNYNMLGLENYDPNEEYVFPPRYCTQFGKIEDIKQISVGDIHTLILKNDNSVWGIGDNENGAIGQDESVAFSTKLVQLKIPDSQKLCIDERRCAIDFVFAGIESTYVVVNTDSPTRGVQFTPMCFGISNIDHNVCSGNGMCFDYNYCRCFKGYFGEKCENKYECNNLNNCFGRGICTNTSTCECFGFSDGIDCSKPKCGNRTNDDPKVCSGKGTCVFKQQENMTIGAQCLCISGWSGLLCGHGSGKDIPVLYSCGKSNLGQTGTGLLTDNVVNFTRVSFEMAEYDKDYKMKYLFSAFFATAFIYGPTIYTINRNNLIFGTFPVTAISGSTYEGFFRVPHPFPVSTLSTTLEVRDQSINYLSAVLLGDGTVFLLNELGSKAIRTRPYELQEAKDSIYTYAGSHCILFLNKNNKVYAHGENTWGEIGKDPKYDKYEFYDWAHVRILDQNDVEMKIAKCCKISYGALCLSVNGKVFRWGPHFTSDPNILPDQFFDKPTQIFPEFGRVLNIDCAPNSGALFNGTWHTFGAKTETPQYHLGHNKTDGKLHFAENWNMDGHDLLSFSSGWKHTLLLFRNKATNKKAVYCIGDNTASVFGFETSIKIAEKPLKVEFPADFPLESITIVHATYENSFIGDWIGDDMNMCNGIPDYLTDFVCGNKGKCVKNGKCECNEGYVNTLDYAKAKELKDHITFWENVQSFCLDFKIDIISLLRMEIPQVIDNDCLSIELIEQFFEDERIMLAYLTAWLIGLVLGPMIFCIVVGVATLFCLEGVMCIANISQNLSKKFFERRWNLEEKEMIKKFLQTQRQSKNGMDTRMEMSVFNLSFNDFKIVNEIGSGGSGALCFEAIDKQNDERVFIKLFVLKTEEGVDVDLSNFKNEIENLTRLRHPNIVTFFGIFFAPPAKLGYVCEYCTSGSLYSFISKLNKRKSRDPRKKDVQFNTAKKVDFMLQISRGMRYLHQKGVFFRDLKPENILIGKNQILKITDFGISTINGKETNLTETKHVNSNGAGTPIYMAPEVVKNEEQSFPADVFSFGIVMHEVLFETVEPYGKDTNKFGIEFEVSNDQNLRPTIIGHVNQKKEEQHIQDRLVELMKKCWNHFPQNRPNFKEIVKELSEIEEEIEKSDM